MKVVCYRCKEKLERTEAAKEKDKYFHPECLVLHQEAADLYSYICFLFGLKTPGPRIYTQIKTYIEKNNYTYNGIKLALKYFFEVKHNNTSIETIGIVPYVYDEAQEYFKNTEHRQADIAKIIGEKIEETPIIIDVKSTPNRKTKKRLIDMDMDDFI